MSKAGYYGTSSQIFKPGLKKTFAQRRLCREFKADSSLTCCSRDDAILKTGDCHVRFCERRLGVKLPFTYSAAKCLFLKSLRVCKSYTSRRSSPAYMVLPKSCPHLLCYSVNRFVRSSVIHGLSKPEKLSGLHSFTEKLPSLTLLIGSSVPLLFMGSPAYMAKPFLPSSHKYAKSYTSIFMKIVLSYVVFLFEQNNKEQAQTYK